MSSDRLGMPEPTYSGKFTATRFVQALAVAKNIIEPDALFLNAQKLWLDRGHIIEAVKSADVSTEDFDSSTSASAAISESFVSMMRPVSVALRLGLRPMPLNVRFFEQTEAVTAAQVGESKAIPIVRGNWQARTLSPLKWGAIAVVTNELLRSGSPVPLQAILNDLARACAIAENRAFASPNATGSVLDTPRHFAGTGDTVTAIRADLLNLVSIFSPNVANVGEVAPGAEFPQGMAFIMSPLTATYLGLLVDGDGAAAFPLIGPQGGELLGLPVLTTNAAQLDHDSPPTRIIGLIDPSRIFYWNGGATLTVSTAATLEMSTAPTGATDVPTAASQNLVSMFQAEAAAVKALRTSAFYASDYAGAYFTVNY